MRITVLTSLLLAGALAVSATASGAQSGQDGGPAFSTEDIPKTETPAEPRPPVEKPATAAARRKAPATAISWQRSFAAAKKAARPGQLIVVDVYTDWCGYCRRMDATIYADPSVASFASDHVFVKLNAEDGAEGQEFARAQGVAGYPTTLVFTNDGRLVLREAGAFRRAQDFLSWLGSAASPT